MARVLVDEGLDDLSEGGQGLVDALGLVKGLTFGSCLGDSLGSSQVNEVKLTHLTGKIDRVVLSNGEDEDGVRAGTFSVHVSGSGGSVLVTKLHELIDLLLTFDVDLTHIL